MRSSPTPPPTLVSSTVCGAYVSCVELYSRVRVPSVLFAVEKDWE
jgi:hypothetical protein